MIKLVVGLGNPGKEYEKTRHNVGWWVLDEISRKLNFSFSKEKFKGLFGEARLNDKKILFLKPLTYMNKSGENVSQFVRFFKFNPDEILVICDDLDLPIGKIRLRLKGSSGGHRGVQSIIDSLGTQNFPRLRLGIGRPERKEEVVNYVLSPFDEKELPIVEEAVKRAATCVIEILQKGEIDQKIQSKCN